VTYTEIPNHNSRYDGAHWVQDEEGIRLERVAVDFPVTLLQERITSKDIQWPLGGDPFVDRFTWPRGFIIRSISIITDIIRGDNFTIQLRVGERDYHTFGPEGLILCDQDHELTHGLVIKAPQYFSFRVTPITPHPFPIRMWIAGSIIREIC
jgi:hypothetical protein